MHKIKKLQGGGYTLPNILSGNPAQTAYTIPAQLDFSSQFKNYSQGVLNNINRKSSYLNNTIPGLPTPEQVQAQVDSFGKTSTTADSNKLGNLSGFLKKSGAGLLNSGTNVATGMIKSLTPQAEDKGSQIAGQAMNTIGDIASAFGPVGSIVGAGAKVLGTLFTSIGPNVKGNTSKELTDSSSSYGGLDKLDSKKFGLFGIGAGKRYAKKVAEREQQRIKSEGILKSAQTDQEAAVGSIQNLANRYNLNMSGGWQQNNGIRFGKSGTKVSYDLSFAHKVLNHLKEESSKKFQQGGKPRSIEELINFAKKSNPRFIQRLSETPKGIDFVDDNGNPARGSHYLESAGEYVIPRIQEIDGELKFLSHDDAVNRAIETGNYLKMTPEEAIIFAKEYKQGWPNFFQKFEEGGKVNVIPEGALHARKHNINTPELDGKITKKGIPVIIEGENGIKQVAEIERNEIIFTKETTEKLEKLRDQYSDYEHSSKEKDAIAIEAGKLLVQEILYNTQDNTGLLNEVK